MITNHEWAANSYGVPNQYSQGTKTLVYGAAFVALGILVHSYYLHLGKYESVRICTDLGCAATALAGLCVYVGSDEAKNGITSTGMFTYIVYQALAPLIIQLCDCYMFYSRLEIVRGKLPNAERFLIHAYIWVILIGTWLPVFTLIPIFYDTDSDEFSAISSILFSIYSYGTLIYNFYFTGQCLWIFRSITHRIIAIRKEDERERLQEQSSVSNNSNRTRMQGATGGGKRPDNILAGLRKIKIVAVKSICHAITSSFAALYYTYGGEAGYDSWNLIIILGMHFWFNMSIENMKFSGIKSCCKKPWRKLFRCLQLYCLDRFIYSPKLNVVGVAASPPSRPAVPQPRPRNRVNVPTGANVLGGGGGNPPPREIGGTLVIMPSGRPPR
jgi:hypothetical protein